MIKDIRKLERYFSSYCIKGQDLKNYIINNIESLIAEASIIAKDNNLENHYKELNILIKYLISDDSLSHIAEQLGVSRTRVSSLSQKGFFRCLRLARIKLAKEAAGVDESTNINYNKPIEEFELSIRAYNCIKRAGIKNVSDVVNLMIEKECFDFNELKFRNVGIRTAAELNERFKDYILEAKSGVAKINIDKIEIINIEDLDIPTRAKTAFKRRDINSVDQMILFMYFNNMRSFSEITNIKQHNPILRNVGIATLAEMDVKLMWLLKKVHYMLDREPYYLKDFNFSPHTTAILSEYFNFEKDTVVSLLIVSCGAGSFSDLYRFNASGRIDIANYTTNSYVKLFLTEEIAYEIDNVLGKSWLITVYKNCKFASSNILVSLPIKEKLRLNR